MDPHTLLPFLYFCSVAAEGDPTGGAGAGSSGAGTGSSGANSSGGAAGEGEGGAGGTGAGDGASGAGDGEGAAGAAGASAVDPSEVPPGEWQPAEQHPAAQASQGEPAPDAGESGKGDEDLATRLAKLEEGRAEDAKRLKSAEDAMRRQILDGLGVKEQYRKFAPAQDNDGNPVDPFTDEGRAYYEKWAQEHPDLIQAAAPAPPPDANLGEELKSLGPNAQAIDPKAYINGWRAIEAEWSGKGWPQ